MSSSHSSAAAAAAAATVYGSFSSETPERKDLLQYWYSPRTIATILEEIDFLGDVSVAFLSTPSVYFSLSPSKRSRHRVFEFDRQWEADPGFIFFDYKKLDDLPPPLLHTFDVVVIDPPLINAEGWTRYAEASKLLLRCDEGGKMDGKVIASTIAKNTEHMFALFGATPQNFAPSMPNLVYESRGCFDDDQYYKIFCNFETRALCKHNTEIFWS